jgi:hypothetical protein
VTGARVTAVTLAAEQAAYLAGGALAFEEGRMGVDQILAVRPGCPPTPGRPR